ncbi:MAG: dihydrodipicolinate synthase family protein [Lentisphaerae bacterium]|jgi:dihydrodipicolinate synthase/N-acetylneuraminate lyase|nr:dihydrodipicolinate synthase family protein [Lentisphaerota bacterium]
MHYTQIPADLLAVLRQGTVIPAMPLALNSKREFQALRQRALARYYIDAGAGGIAVGVHSTQFEIRDPAINLFEKVLRTVSEAIDEWSQKSGRRILKIAGVCGRTDQALYEADFAVQHGYHAGLLSLSAYRQDSQEAMLEHCRKVAERIPLIGFYLQPAVGGRVLPYSFWREFAEIDNLIAIKMAPFNRYQTLDVVRAVCEAGREKEITLYTGNDDNIVVDLLTEYCLLTSKGEKRVCIKGGLLGHWCVWTQAAVKLLRELHEISSRKAVPAELLSLAVQVTDCNAAFFDAANNFKGCIPGIHEVLRRQGLLEGTWCLNPQEVLSCGQSEEIDRVYRSYPQLHDDLFVKANLERWLQE